MDYFVVYLTLKNSQAKPPQVETNLAFSGVSWWALRDHIKLDTRV